jgi:glucokinase
MSEKYAIGVDFGGTNLRVALVSEGGKIIKKVKRPSSEEILEALAESIEEIRHPDAICGIGLGVAGLIDRKNNRVFSSPNLRAIEGLDLVGELQRRFGAPVFLENDANAAALGERMAGAGRDFENFVLLTLGTGIGGGIIYRGRVLEVPAELGHMSINPEAEKCPCGNTGCLENYASARAMIARAVSMLEKGTESLLKECCKGSFYKLTPEDIYGAALDGDNLSREVLKDAGRYLGVGLANIINVLGPEAIILAGGLTGAWNIYVQEAMKEASRRAFKDLFEAVKIIPSSLEDNAGIIGSACLVFSNLPGPASSGD